MSLKVWLTEQITDKSGKILLDRKRRSHSFVLQFLDLIAALVGHAFAVAAADELITDTGAVARTIRITSTPVADELCAAGAPGANTNYGIVVGTGTNAENVNDYALQTLVAEGAGAGQLNYGATGHTGAVAAGGITSFTLSRAMANNSGGQITIEEVAIYVSGDDSASTQRYFCIIRDLTGGTAVGNGQTYTVTYTIETSV